MSDFSLLQEIQAFAVELRKLAYTMPAGHEDRLIGLSDRMAGRARHLLQTEARATWRALHLRAHWQRPRRSVGA